MTKKPVVLVIMDGVGKGDGGPGDAVKLANTPNLDRLFATCPHNWLKAHGTAVGLPTDDDSWNFESFTKDEYEAVKAKIASGEITVDNSSDDATKPTVSEFTTVTYIQ